MEELTIEQKAKLYDEAIEKGKQILNAPYTAHWDTMKGVVELLLPQLAESEDEKMRKNIMVVLANTDLSMFSLDYTFADMVAWLNRKGEKSQDKSTFEAPEGV